MDWRLKALAFRALALPGGAHAHYFLQRHVTRNWPRRAKTLDALAGIAHRVIEDYARHRGGTPKTVLEVGAGRDLAVPLALRRLGVEKVIACDVERLGKLDLVQHAADRILVGQLNLSSWDDLERFGVNYLAPHYVSQDDEPVDCSCSNEVLEHVPADQLAKLLTALRAVTKGITTHSIDYSDHYARSDKSVSRLNFLRYSEKEWRPFNSGKQYVNRLRHSDYVRMFKEAGFTILEESSVAGDPPPDLKLADQFKRYDPADLFAIKGRIIAA
ncbi:class I SAM-dependent methyltransferase [Bradyrhizobium guangxiense]|uniref:class I SAM-dependent methyltransferase n=1 Tax=Bradyrhizobium guangxiense TaxID=1325115 RepID=UPI001008B2E7|nr:class I SAM-dependent methyltransferase [Bradyrhizobium guangxiense]